MVDPGLWPALRRRWWIPVILAIVLGGVGAVLATQRDPRYEATTRITIASPNFQTQSVPGFVAAVQSLAGSYAQTVKSPAVLGKLAQARHTSVASLAGDISSTPVPESTLFTIKARQSSPGAAVQLANDTARATKTYIASLDDTDQRTREVLKRYKQYSAKVAEAQGKLDRLREHNAAIKGSVSATRLASQQTAVDSAQVLQTAAGQQYQQLITSNSAQQARTLAVLSPAVSADSDRNTYIQRYVLIGAAGGLVLGALFALLLGLGRRERSAPRPS